MDATQEAMQDIQNQINQHEYEERLDREAEMAD